jgi:hypothetical protein
MRRAAVVLVLLLAAAAGRASAQTVVFGVGGHLVGENGAVIRAPVYADLRAAGGQLLGSYTLRLQWAPGVLSYQGVEAGLFGLPVAITDSTFAGVLRVGGLSAAGVGGLFNLFSVRMVVTGSQSSPVTLTVGEAVAAGTFTDITSLVTVANGTYCPAVGRWGDIDGDGQADSRDALGILSDIVDIPLGQGFTIALGDVDGDGLVNSRDALIILSYAVGLAIPGQRVLVYAPGACGGSGALGLTILPDTVDVAVGQSVQLLLAGTLDGTPAGTSVNWSVGNPELAVVTAEGVLSGRAAGATTVTAALGPGIGASVPVLVRAQRGTWHVDAARAPLAAMQLGTQRYPFATPQYAFPIARDGDTVRVAPGVHDYLGGDICTGGTYGGDAPPAGGPPAPAPPPDQCARGGDLNHSIVLWGDTLADGTRPVLRGNPDASRAVYLYGGISLEVRHLDFRGFQEGIYQNDPTRRIEVVNTVFDLRGPDGYSGIAGYYGVDTLILRDVEFLGDPLRYATAVDIEDGIGLAVLDRVVVDDVQYGIYLYGADSLDVRDSQLWPAAYQALYLYGSVGGTRAYITRSDLRTFYDPPLWMDDVKSLLSEHNTYRTLGGTNGAVQVYGLESPPRPGSRFVSRGDSLIATKGGTGIYDYAFQVQNLDTILVDSAVIVGPDSGFVRYPGYLYAGAEARLRNSVLLNISGTPLSLGGREIEVSNSSFTGCRAACSTAYGIQATNHSTPVHRFQVTGNTFYRMYTAVEADYYGEVGWVVAQGNAIDSVYTGFLLYADSMLVTDNVVTRAAYASGYGVYAAARYLAGSARTTLQRNRVTTLGGYALYATNTHVSSAGNRYTGVGYGAYLYDPTGTGWQVAMDRDTVFADSAAGGYAVYLYGAMAGSVRRSRVTGGGGGIYSSLTGGTLVLDSNVITGTRTYGVYTTAAAGTSVTGRWNNVTDNRTYGVYSSGTGTFAFTNGRFVGNLNRAIYAASGTVDATNNWWNSANGPTPPDTVFGAVTTVPFLGTDPGGVTVPLAPPAGAFVADLWRAPIGSRRAAAAVPADPLPVPAVNPRLAREAWFQERRAEAEQRRRELLARREQRQAARDLEFGRR